MSFLICRFQSFVIQVFKRYLYNKGTVFKRDLCSISVLVTVLVCVREAGCTRMTQLPSTQLKVMLFTHILIEVSGLIMKGSQFPTPLAPGTHLGEELVCSGPSLVLLTASPEWIYYAISSPMHPVHWQSVQSLNPFTMSP